MLIRLYVGVPWPMVRQVWYIPDGVFRKKLLVQVRGSSGTKQAD